VNDIQDASLLETVARAARLREGPPGVAAVIRSVYRRGSSRLREVAQDVHLPFPVATAVRRELERAGLLERKQGLSLTPSGRRFAELNLGLRTDVDVVCETCHGRGIVVPPALTELTDHLTSIVANAPAVDVTLDQAPCTPETSIMRALLMLETGALEGRRVLVLGDDDSVSIAIGLIGKSLRGTDLTRRLAVVDADARRLSFISDVARDERFAVDVVHHDLREPLPEHLRGNFDVVETDPPYTLAGARLFLARGAEALMPAASGQVFFSFAEWSGEQLLELEQLSLELGFAIRRIRSGFNRYVGATVLGNVGQLFELVQVVPPSKEMLTWDAPLYTAQFRSGPRVYVCASCNAEITLGEDGTPSTIEALKAAGCPECTGRVFRRRAGRT